MCLFYTKIHIFLILMQLLWLSHFLSSFLLYLLYFLSYRNHVRQFLPLKMHTTKLQKLETTPGNWWCSFITLTYRSWNITKYEFTLKWSTTKFISYTGYVILAALTVGVVAFTFYQLKRYRVLVAYSIAPFLAFCNAYRCGLTDWSRSSCSAHGLVLIMEGLLPFLLLEVWWWAFYLQLLIWCKTSKQVT